MIKFVSLSHEGYNFILEFGHDITSYQVKLFQSSYLFRLLPVLFREGPLDEEIWMHGDINQNNLDLV